MMHYIQNLRTLATTPARADALAIAEAGLAAIDTQTVLRNTLQLAGDTLTIQGTQFSLGDFRHIYVVGFGKVACTAALTLEELLAGRVVDGAVVGIKEKVCQVVDTYAGTHPLPSSLNYTATRHIEEVARRATADDLVLVVVSGGGSALLCSSMSECEQGTQLFSSFLPSGGTIEELNIVRKHISTLKGGGLAKTLYPATVASLVFSDVPGGDMAAVASGPTCQDSSTIDDARAIIERYRLGTFNLVETPKDDKYFTNVHNFLVASNEVALEAMAAEATKRGYQSEILAKTQYATPEETQSLLTKQAAPGTVYLVGGETKLVIPDNCTGKGGRNDYLALHMLEALMPGQVFVSLASDGKDNTTAAGALADAETARKAAQAGLNVTDYEPCRNSFPFFDTVGDHIVTGPLESNVSDLMMLLNPGHTSKRQPVPIESITAEVIKDSRGKDTIAVTVAAGGETGTFSVPSGASTGSREVHAKPAKEAVRIIRKLVAPALCGHNVHDQQGLDERLHTLDSTPLFDVIGGNTALGVSVAALKASAAMQGVEPWQYVAELFEYRAQSPAPRLFVNLINGGAHASAGSDIQEHQIIPNTLNVAEALAAAAVVQATLKRILEAAYGKEAVGIGDEGGFVIPSELTEEPFSYVQRAIKESDVDIEIFMGADMAASSFCQDGVYTLNGVTYTPTALRECYQNLHTQFPLLRYVEDPCQEGAVGEFAAYQAMFPAVLTIGDDLTTTSDESLVHAAEHNAITGIIIKPNQIGTITDTLKTMAYAYECGIQCIVSHRSGETTDDFIADLAYGTKCYGLKAGAPTAPERAVKYQRLSAILK